MPVEPVTPPGSTTWRILHFPVVLIILAVGWIVAAGLGVNLVEPALRSFNHVPGGRYLGPMFGATAIVAIYWVFVRFVERRRDIEELGTSGSLGELVLGFGAGLGLSAISFAILFIIGGVHVYGYNPPRVLLFPLVVQCCGAIILEIVLRGFFFRQVERLLGSWLSLILSAIAFGSLALLRDTFEPFAMVADILNAGILFAAMYMVTRRLWAVIGLHAAWSLARIALYGSPMTANGPRGLVLSQVIGPDWLTGGRNGANASVPALVCSAVLVTILLITAVRRGHIVRPIWQRGRSTKTR